MQPTTRAVTSALVVTGAVMAIGCVWAAAAGVPQPALFRDPQPFAHTPLYVGVLSTAGLLVWSAGAAIALATGLGLRSEAPADPLRRFLVEAGALTVVVTLDDALLVHETVGPHATGLPEEAFLAAYGVAAVAVLARAFPALRRRSDRGALALALGLLTASIVLDLMGTPLRLFTGRPEAVRNVTEEATKLLGIVAWTGYLTAVARDAWLTARPAPTRVVALPAQADPPAATADRARVASRAT